MFAVKDCDTCSDGIVHMDAWKKIRGGIRTVKMAHHIGKNIIPWKYFRAQAVTVRIYCRDDEKQRHSYTEKNAQPDKFLCICKKEKCCRCNDIGKPKDSFDQKSLTALSVD